MQNFEISRYVYFALVFRYFPTRNEIYTAVPSNNINRNSETSVPVTIANNSD